jgi:homocysteine S-methyltransferase
MIVDGGLASELEGRGHDLSDELWSARLLADAPEAITQVHHDYLDAGADVVIAASYQASLPAFERRGHSRAQAEALIRAAVELARAAVDAHTQTDRPRWAAASVGPYGALLANGAEYTGAYDVDEAGLLAFHRERWRILADSGAHLLACETLPSLPEIRALRRLSDDTATPAWFSFSCADGERLRDGTPIENAVATLAAAPNIVAVGVNCTAPAYVEALVRRVRGSTDLPVIVYPNSGEGWDADGRRWSGERGDLPFADMAGRWRDAGATAIGGCCRTTPADIRAVHERFRAPAREGAPAGYSGKPLWQKLGIKEGIAVRAEGWAGDYSALVGRPVPTTRASDASFVHAFVTTRAALAEAVGHAARSLPGDGTLWVSWPKRTSGVPSEVGEDDIRAVALPLGLVDNKVCAVDGTWSGLRLSWRRG